MSKFYGTVRGHSPSEATRRGHDFITAAAQSWNGSVITRLSYAGDKLMVTVCVEEGSTALGTHVLFCGTFDEFKAQLRK